MFTIIVWAESWVVRAQTKPESTPTAFETLYSQGVAIRRHNRTSTMSQRDSSTGPIVIWWLPKHTGNLTSTRSTQCSLSPNVCLFLLVATSLSPEKHVLVVWVHAAPCSPSIHWCTRWSFPWQPSKIWSLLVNLGFETDKYTGTSMSFSSKL